VNTRIPQPSFRSPALVEKSGAAGIFVCTWFAASDLDCAYHMALYGLGESVEQVTDETLGETFNLLVDGKRLRDISDLPFDLAI
jgi:hypothetical protein